MRSMELIFIILAFLLGGLLGVDTVPLTGELGKDIKIKCSHSNAFSNIKYFCKGDCINEDILISSKGKKMNSKGRYSIKDNGNTFFIEISHLTIADSGIYWCAIDRVGMDTYNKVVLTVIEGKKKEPENVKTDVNSIVNTSSSQRMVYVTAGFGVVLLALAVILLIFLGQRKRNIRVFQGKGHDTTSAKMSRLEQKAQADTTTSSSTAKDDHATGSRTNSSFLSSSADRHQGCADNIYSNVSSQLPPEGPVYSTVSFNRGSAVTPPSERLTSSPIQRMATVVYADVWP